jgi:hypothetical protein
VPYPKPIYKIACTLFDIIPYRAAEIPRFRLRAFL